METSFNEFYVGEVKPTRPTMVNYTKDVSRNTLHKLLFVPVSGNMGIIHAQASSLIYSCIILDSSVSRRNKGKDFLQ